MPDGMFVPKAAIDFYNMLNTKQLLEMNIN
jgi:hypothetical protein